jgi:hypothetical protein
MMTEGANTMDSITLTIYTKTFTHDDIYDGEINVEADESSVEIEPEEDETLAQAIAKWVDLEGLTADGTCDWFYELDGSHVVNYYRGEHAQVTAHLPDDAPDDLMEQVRRATRELHMARQRRLDEYLSRNK